MSEHLKARQEMMETQALYSQMDVNQARNAGQDGSQDGHRSKGYGRRRLAK
jgi:hypothetical protein